NNLHSYLPDEMETIADHSETLAEWIQAAPEGACYAIGRVLNHVLNTNRALGENIVMLVEPRALAKAISAAAPLHAGEIAELLSMIGA
ncbi:hypothetical protein OFO99_33685, partial [Escherichia coli]|nr:hypothetical protein [Escherichia coli]